jgi:protoporphyrinogen IX oxidase
MYLWLKALHIIAIIAWMAGMLYMPRLFVYHCDAEPGSKQSETFKVMERRLQHGIIAPAMILSWVLGLWLAFETGFIKSGWLHAKLTLVVAMTVLDGFYLFWWRAFTEDRNQHSSKFFRIINEVPTLILIGIVLLVVLKPF